eukprot:229410_1
MSNVYRPKASWRERRINQAQRKEVPIAFPSMPDKSCQTNDVSTNPTSEDLHIQETSQQSADQPLQQLEKSPDNSEVRSRQDSWDWDEPSPMSSDVQSEHHSRSDRRPEHESRPARLHERKQYPDRVNEHKSRPVREREDKSQPARRPEHKSRPAGANVHKSRHERVHERTQNQDQVNDHKQRPVRVHERTPRPVSNQHSERGQNRESEQNISEWTPKSQQSRSADKSGNQSQISQGKSNVVQNSEQTSWGIEKSELGQPNDQRLERHARRNNKSKSRPRQGRTPEIREQRSGRGLNKQRADRKPEPCHSKTGRAQKARGVHSSRVTETLSDQIPDRDSQVQQSLTEQRSQKNEKSDRNSMPKTRPRQDSWDDPPPRPRKSSDIPSEKSPHSETDQPPTSDWLNCENYSSWVDPSESKQDVDTVTSDFRSKVVLSDAHDKESDEITRIQSQVRKPELPSSSAVISTSGRFGSCQKSLNRFGRHTEMTDPEDPEEKCSDPIAQDTLQELTVSQRPLPGTIMPEVASGPPPEAVHARTYSPGPTVEFDHVLVVSGLPEDMKPDQLPEFLGDLMRKVVDIRFTRSGDALVVFYSSSDARRTLNGRQPPFCKIRALTRCDIRNYTPILETVPVAKRPKSSTRVAERLIGRALSSR